MTLDEAREYIAKFTYKPRWYFSILDPATQDQLGILRVMVTVNDSTQPWSHLFNGKTINTTLDLPLWYVTDLETLQAALIQAVEKREFHEMREWLKYEGACIVDPRDEHVPGTLPSEALGFFGA